MNRYGGNDPIDDAPQSAGVVAVEQDGTLVALVSGEVDANSADHVFTEVVRCLDQRPAALVIDLDPVTFFDSSGIRVLLELGEQSAAHGVRFAVAASNRVVVRPLTVTTVDRVLPLYASRTEAIAAVHGHEFAEQDKLIDPV
ncbi:hypothetical protein GCM10011609_87170 [Lentzea pudingi]|uniref:Anti-sigma factor antagonist n=1 Tax=Lentzea pudingi TaxID=1789439 RepID=A0ABQ2IXR3_9PSEU|nr:hypothetical protein GCM10011609_87170 [Lentzea pudingi]